MRLLKLGFALVFLLFLQIEAIEKEVQANPCSVDSLPCDNNQCVRREEWCDKKKNCEDESDEAYCKTAWFKHDPNHCEETHFLCKNGMCLPRVVECDGRIDCKDESDEYDCGPDAQDDSNDYNNTETTSDITIAATTTERYFESNGMALPDFPITTTQVPTVTFTQNAPKSSSTVNFYANRMEQERDKIDLQSPTSYPSRSSIISRPAPTTAPKRDHNLGILQIINTSRPLLSTTTHTRAYEKKSYHDPSTTPIPVSPGQTVPKRLPYTSTTIYTTRSRHGQSNTPSHQSTRSYVHGQYPYQYSTQPTRLYATRRDPYQHHNQPTRSYDYGRDRNHYQTQPTTPYDTRRDRNRYHNQPTRSYDSRGNHQQSQPTRPNEYRRDPYQYQTQPSRPDGFRRPLVVPTIRPQHPYHATYIPNSRNHYAAGVTQRIYVDRENYYDGYYDQSGHFVVLFRSQRRQSYGSPPTDGVRRTRQNPELPTTAPAIFERHLKAPSRFYFSKNYTRSFGDGNISYLRKGREWILSVRNSTGGWGKNTPRALIALSLINNSFVNGTYENDMMKKYFQVYLGTRLLRGDPEVTSLSRLAMSINALMATCQNPRNFHGIDLTDQIQKRLVTLERENQRNYGDRTRTVSVNPAVYLSLCLADRDLTHLQIRDLMTRLNAYLTPGEYSRDMLSLSISAFSCHLRRQKSGDSEYQRIMDSMLSNATTKLLDRMLDDGSFGSVYGTALATQALLSLNDTKHWNSESTFDFLKQQQMSDGSFGDFLATYLVLPVLSGRSLLHLRNTQCTPLKSDRDLTPQEILAFSGPKHHVRYSLYFGHPKVNGFSVELLVPRGISFFDMMRVAQYEKDVFKFSYEERNGKTYVYSISNVPNDAEQGFEWHLYAKRSSDLELNNLNTQERILGDIREFYPRSDQHVIFWYHPNIN